MGKFVNREIYRYGDYYKLKFWDLPLPKVFIDDIEGYIYYQTKTDTNGPLNIYYRADLEK